MVQFRWRLPSPMWPCPIIKPLSLMAACVSSMISLKYLDEILMSNFTVYWWRNAWVTYHSMMSCSERNPFAKLPYRIGLILVLTNDTVLKNSIQATQHVYHLICCSFFTLVVTWRLNHEVESARLANRVFNVKVVETVLQTRMIHEFKSREWVSETFLDFLKTLKDIVIVICR